MRFRGYSWTASSRKHRIRRDQVRFVVEQARTTFARPAVPPAQPDDALLFVGDDADGVPLEVVGVELDDGRLRVLHAMPLRDSYRALYEEAKR